MSRKTVDRLLEQIRQSAYGAVMFVEGLSLEDFLRDEKTQKAVAMNLLITGENASRILADHPHEQARLAHLSLENMRGMRNRIAHGYFQLRFDVVWDTVTQDLPVLIAQLDDILDNGRQDGQG